MKDHLVLTHSSTATDLRSPLDNFEVDIDEVKLNNSDDWNSLYDKRQGRENLKKINQALKTGNTIDIEAVFKSYKELVYSFIPLSLYTHSDLNVLTQALITTHKELFGRPQKEKALEEIYQIMNKEVGTPEIMVEVPNITINY